MSKSSDELLAEFIINKQLFQLMDICTNDFSPPNVKMPACAALLGALSAKRGLKLADYKASITEKQLIDQLNLLSNNAYKKYTDVNNVLKVKLAAYENMNKVNELSTGKNKDEIEKLYKRFLENKTTIDSMNEEAQKKENADFEKNKTEFEKRKTVQSSKKIKTEGGKSKRNKKTKKSKLKSRFSRKNFRRRF